MNLLLSFDRSSGSGWRCTEGVDRYVVPELAKRTIKSLAICRIILPGFFEPLQVVEIVLSYPYNHGS